MSDPALTVSVVICAYANDRWDDLNRAVASVQAQDRAPDEIVVVIDHNAELDRRAAAELTGPGLRVMASVGRPGLSAARNTGIAAATGDVVAFLDDDAVAEPGWLTALIDPYRDPAVIATGGAALPAWSGSRPAWFPPEYDWVVGCAYRGLPVTTAPVRNVIGANMSFRRSVFETVGGFTEGMGRVGRRPDGCEETELCIRATALLPGTQILYVPAARVHHTVPAERMTWRYFRARCYAEGRSKAGVVRAAGSSEGLRSERTHVARVLSLAVAAGLSDSVARREPGGIRRSVAVVAGLAITAAGFAGGLRR